jgi:hypothetical protein
MGWKSGTPQPDWSKSGRRAEVRRGRKSHPKSPQHKKFQGRVSHEKGRMARGLPYQALGSEIHLMGFKKRKK